VITGKTKETAERTFDPLRYCIFTTIALIAWAVGPPVAVALMSALGIAAYWSAWRAGLRTSKCVLRDVRLVLAYLTLAFLAAAAVVVRGLLN
jgi:hypothetical protein